MPQVKNDPTDKSISVVLDHDNIWVDDTHYEGKKGTTIKVSPRDAEMMRKHGFVKQKDAN